MHGWNRAGIPGIRDGAAAAPQPDRSLAALVSRDGPFGVEDGLAILESVLEEVAALHRFERPHGAVVPDNVFVERTETGALLAVIGPADRTGGTRVREYLPPERRAGEEPTLDADTWAVGALAYPIFAGRAPEWTPHGKLESLALAAPEVPLRLGGVVARMLAAEPELRPSVEEALGAVRSLRAAWRPVDAEATPGPPSALRERGSNRWLGGLLRRKSEAPAPARGPAPAPAAPSLRLAGGASLALLCVEDFGPIERIPQAPPSDDDLQESIDETLSAGLRVQDLPTFPAVAFEVVDLAKREDVGANELVRLINRDPALTAAVLRMANSAYANRGIEVTSARDAVTRLGLREVANVAAAAATRALFEVHGARVHPVIAQESRRIWIHSLASSLSASWLAMQCDADTQRAFLGGMLHDVGKTLALRGLGQALAGGVLRGIDPAAVIGPVLEVTHVELGLRLARAWKLPEPVLRACAEHHVPRCGPHDDPELHLVRVASGMCSLRLDPAWKLDRVREAQESATLLGFDRFRIRAVAAQVRELAARAEALAAD